MGNLYRKGLLGLEYKVYTMATKSKYEFKMEMCDQLIELGKVGASQK